MRERLYKLLREDFEIVKAVANGRDLVSAALELMPGAVVSDTSMPLLGGLDAMWALDLAGAKMPIILISSVFRRAGVSRHPGATAYVDKIDLDLDLVAAVKSAATGQFFLSRSIPASQPVEDMNE
jgi:two-component system, NarL family, response regulator NreC